GGNGGTIKFYVNGKQHVVPLGERFSPTTSLNEYLRESAGLPGTKVMCREAGCGCCAVTVTTPDPAGNGEKTQSINSCLCPLLSVDGWQVTTVEGIGNEKEGFHPIQERIAKFNGTQCGYCTPGMVMNMYGLLHDNPKPSEQDVEDNFDGNICRCTGYRSILDAMKSFAADTQISDGGLIDIEDLNKKLCPRTGQPCKDEGNANGSVQNGSEANGSAAGSGFSGLHVQTGSADWYRPTSLQELGGLMRKCKENNVRLLFGNTSAGIFKNEGPFDVYIDLREVKELYKITVTDSSVKFGANTTLSVLIKTLKSLTDTQPGFEYFAVLVRHLKLVGNVLMRNAASVAGNLMIKHVHPDFPSDVFTMTEAAGAKVEIYDSKDGSLKAYTVQDFVRKVNMKGKVLAALEVPALDALDHFRSYKITPRSQNAHAYVNAAFRFKVSGQQQILGKPSIVIGGIDEKLFHAEKTEDFLRGKEIKDNIVKEALAMLKSELNPAADPVLSPPEYRRDLAVNLLYKTLLGIIKPSEAKLQTGGTNIERPLSSGLQTFQEKKDEWPLKQPMPKRTAKLQASGEAEYVNDMPRYQHELCGALVMSTVGNATIESIDPSPALALPGVEQFITAEDIPEGGINNAYANYKNFPLSPEEVFCTSKIEYAGQIIGVILAETQTLADAAAKKVVVKYKDIKKPVLTVEEAIEAKAYHQCFLTEKKIGDPDDAMAKAAHTVSGEIYIGTQYHFYMETIVRAHGRRDGNVYHNPGNRPSTRQHCCHSQQTHELCQCPCATTGWLVWRPVRLSHSLSTAMQNSGKRFPLLTRYKAGFTQEGKMEVLDIEFFMDAGWSNASQFTLAELVSQIDQGYYIPNWKINPHMMKTNKPPAAPVRGPGTTPASSVIETIMEHVAKAVNKHPILLKEINLYEKHQKDLQGKVLTYCTMRETWDRLKHVAEIEKRMADVDAFNQASQWKKRGITMCAVKYGMVMNDTGMPLLLSVYAGDGTVTVTQGGVEMGQGLYVKVAQAVAHSLGIPLDMIKVRPNQSFSSPNSTITGGSTTSERSVNAALEACKILRERLEPIKAKMPDADWKTLVFSAVHQKVDLSVKVAKWVDNANPSEHHLYFTYCTAACETEVDILTGEYAIRRVDIMFDCGESLNPTVDIGQIEGGFVFGLGCNLLEDIVYDSETGCVLNDGTWEYKPPTTKDIPIDWRIHLLPDAPNPVGIRSSKASGEPPTGLAVGALLAVKLGMESAQKDLTGSSSFIKVDIPFTVDKIQQKIGVQLEHLKL
ncbi:hypothetical protein BaRGS_00002012, partial [Batillaria attramentaria]